MEETIILTKYIAAWAWHLTAMIFLSTMALLLVESNYALAIGFGMVMAYCEYKAIKRKMELDNGED